MFNETVAVLAGVSLLAIAGCAGRPSVPRDSGTLSPFLLERDLAGKTVGTGSFSAITGQKRGFTAYLEGSWDGETFTLAEDFVFDDGETDKKTWVLKKTGDGRYEGAREDTVGTAIGFQDGDVFRLEYFMQLGGENGGGRKVKFRDIMFKRADGIVINHATVGYWGLNVAKVELEVKREAAVQSTPSIAAE